MQAPMSARARPVRTASYVAILLGSGVLLSSASLFGSDFAHAQAPDPRGVTVECATLGGTEEAALVARLSGSLLSFDEASALLLTCEGTHHAAELTLREQSFKVDRQATSQDESFQLLLELGFLVVGKTEATPEESHVADTPSLQTAPVGSAVVRPETERSPSENFGTLIEEQPHSRPARKKQAAVVFLAAGAAYQHWGTEVMGALGPEIAAGGLFHRFLLEGSFTPYWGLGHSDGYTLRDMRWGLAFGVRPTSWLLVAVQPFLSLAHASGPPEAMALAENRWRPGVSGLVEGAWTQGAWGIVLRAGVSFVGAKRVLEQDGERRLQVPFFQPILGLGVRYALLR